jgi:hypothetical protein
MMVKPNQSKIERQRTGSHVCSLSRQLCRRSLSIFNISTKGKINSHTAMFLHKTYTDYFNMSKDLMSQISAADSEGEIETHEVILTPEQPDEPFMNLVKDLPEDEEEADEEKLQFTTISNNGLRELRNLTTY